MLRSLVAVGLIASFAGLLPAQLASRTSDEGPAPLPQVDPSEMGLLLNEGPVRAGVGSEF